MSGEAGQDATDEATPAWRRRSVLGRLALLVAGAFGVSRVMRFEDDDGNGGAEPTAPSEPFNGLAELVLALPADADHGSAGDSIRSLVGELRQRARGGVVHLPPGEWVIDAAIVIDATGVTLTGAGMRATRLRLADDVRDHVVSVTADGVTIERLTIVGNGATTGGDNLGHGIRVGDNAEHVQIRDVVIEDVQGYGIGFQPQPAPTGEAFNVGGVFDHAVVHDVAIVGSGYDAIDFKNYDGDDVECPDESYEDAPPTPPGCNGGRSFLRNVSVAAFAQHPDVSGRAGIDLRGRRHLQNIDALDLDADANGIEFRTDAGGRPNGLGGFWSTLENFYVATDGSLESGIENGDIEGVEYHNGFVVGPDGALRTT